MEETLVLNDAREIVKAPANEVGATNKQVITLIREQDEACNDLDSLEANLIRLRNKNKLYKTKASRCRRLLEELAGEL